MFLIDTYYPLLQQYEKIIGIESISSIKTYIFHVSYSKLNKSYIINTCWIQIGRRQLKMNLFLIMRIKNKMLKFDSKVKKCFSGTDLIVFQFRVQRVNGTRRLQFKEYHVPLPWYFCRGDYPSARQFTFRVIIEFTYFNNR